MEVTRDELIDAFNRVRSANGQRNGEYDKARQYYLGQLWDDANPAPTNRYSLTPNYLKPIIDKSIQLLVGMIPGTQVMPPGVDALARSQAERLEGLIYEAWDKSDAPKVFFQVAWDSFVLRRGLIYYWWDHDKSQAMFKSCIPDDFYPEWDGDRMYRAFYVHRRLTDALRKQYPDEDIYDDPGMDQAYIAGQDEPRVQGDGYTTVVDCYWADGSWTRMAAGMVKHVDLGYPVKEVPFIEFPCYPVGGNREPLSQLDQLVELNQYLCQIMSQKADIISKYSNPPVLDLGSGQAPEEIRKALASPGSVIPVRKEGDLKYLNWEGSTPEIDSMIEKVQDILFDLSGKPRSSFGQTVTNQSGVVTNLTLTPTLQSNEAHEAQWGQRLSLLNERILQLTEKFGAGTERVFRGRVPTGKASASRYVEIAIDPAEIDGWYKNRIKWPSAIRVDDPVYVQNLLSQLTSDPPALSLYTYLEEMGREDVEAEIDRIQQQLEDPRLHPEVAESAMNIAQMAQGGGATGAGLSGGLPSVQQGATLGDALSSTGSPYADTLANA